MFSLTAQHRHGWSSQATYQTPLDINNTVRAGGRGSLTAKHKTTTLSMMALGIRTINATRMLPFAKDSLMNIYRAKAAGVGYAVSFTSRLGTLSLLMWWRL